MRDSDISELADIKEIEVPGPQAILINGRLTRPTCKRVALACPKCGRPLYAISDPTATVDSVTLSLGAQAERQLLEVARFCPGCGIKLRYAREIVSAQAEAQEQEPNG